MLLWCESKEGHCVLKPPRTSRYCPGQSRPLSTHGLSINPARPRSRWTWTTSENRFLRFHRLLGRNSIGNQFDIHKSQLLRRGCSARKRASHQINSKNAQDSVKHTFSKSIHSHISRLAIATYSCSVHSI